MSAPTPLTLDALRRMPPAMPIGETDKDERGRVLVVAGSPEVPGAALLAGVAALRSGAGKLQIAAPASVATHLGVAVPESRVFPIPETADGGIGPGASDRLLLYAGRCQAVVLGPGMIDEDGVAALTADLLGGVEGPAFILDAGALVGLRNFAESVRRQGGRVVITPHAGEMATLLDIERQAVVDAPLDAARRAAALLQAVVALKGSVTHVVTPQGEAWLFTGGHVGLATSGSGDTLAGLIGGLLARGAPPLAAALWGVSVHGEAGCRLARTRGPLGFLAREILDEIPGILAEWGGEV